MLPSKWAAFDVRATKRDCRDRLLSARDPVEQLADVLRRQKGAVISTRQSTVTVAGWLEVRNEATGEGNSPEDIG